MKTKRYQVATATAAALVVSGWAAGARAQQQTFVQAPPPVQVQPAPAQQTFVVAPAGSGRDTVTQTEKVPNRGLITSGAVMFGIPFTASVIVASSSRKASDRNLFVPVLGPWIDLASRRACVETSCQGETTNKVLLVTDGVFQTVGAFNFVAGFLFPTTRTVTQKASVRVAPTAGASNVGLAAYGAF
jgi:hypothetical protein